MEARPGPMARDWDFHGVMPALAAKALEWIGRQRDQAEPFFLYLALTSPHAPIVPAPEFVGKSKADGYGDYMVQTDWTVGQVLRALDEHGFRDNTLVIFTSDNGPEDYAFERLRRYGHRSSGPLRGVKRDVWEGGHRIPFVVRWPGVVPGNRVSPALISQVDIMATLAAVSGVSLRAGTAEDSHDLLPLWRGQATGPRRSTVYNTKPGVFAVRQDQWAFIDAGSGGVNPVPAWFDTEYGYVKNEEAGELYDLSEDLAERHNLYARYPGKVAELRELLTKTLKQGEVRTLATAAAGKQPPVP